MPVKVTILGTSNSILHTGYVSGLAQVDDIEIVANTSVGSSHSVMIPLLISDEALAQSDYVVVDLTINEQRALTPGLYNLDTMRDIFFYVLGKCRTHDVIPVFLLLPMQKFEDSYPIIREYKTLCQAYGVPYLDPERSIKAEAGRRGRAWAEMFADHHHLIPDINEWIGWMLGAALKEADRTTGDSLAITPPRFDFVAAAPFAGSLRTIQRKTNLIGLPFVQMTAGQTLTMAIEPETSIVGVALNMSNTNANLRIRGKTETAKRLNSSYFDPKRTLRLVVWQVVKTVQAKDGQVTLTCEGDDRRARVESNDHFAPSSSSFDNPVVELAGLIVRSATPSPQASWLRYCQTDLNPAPG